MRIDVSIWTVKQQRETGWFDDEEHNVWNQMLELVGDGACSPTLQDCLQEEDTCKVALSCHLALEQKTELRGRGRRSSGEITSTLCVFLKTARCALSIVPCPCRKW